MILKKIGIFVGTLLLASFVNADVLEVKENHPTKYVVQKGDTLWDIAEEYADPAYYTISEYVEELKSMNGLNRDTIHAGNSLVIAYYE